MQITPRLIAGVNFENYFIDNGKLVVLKWYVSLNCFYKVS